MLASAAFAIQIKICSRWSLLLCTPCISELLGAAPYLNALQDKFLEVLLLPLLWPRIPELLLLVPHVHGEAFRRC